MTVVIIEDEPLLAEELKEEIMAADSSIEVVAQLASIKETLKYLVNHPLPDLFFSDIELSDGLSFEIFKQIQNKTPIIFCTAYNQYALDAFQVYGVDYLLKPFDREQIRAALEKYNSLVKVRQESDLDYQKIAQLLTQKQAPKQTGILIHSGDKIIPLDISKIALVCLKNGVVYVLTFEGKRIATNYNMEKLSQLLGNVFYRVNRQYLINRKGVKHVNQYFARKLLIQPTFQFEEQLIVSKANASDFLRWLERN